jgi:colanic acid biosynthesis glycosyl transferase WcaI
MWAAVLRPHRKRPWRPYQTEIVGRVSIIRAGSTDFPRFNMKKRVLNYLSYVALAIPRALFVPCDVVIAMTDPPFQGIVGAMVAMLKRKPYVYNIRDLYPDMAVGGSIVEPGILSKIWEKLHRWALRHAARVIVLGEDRRERMMVVRDGTEVLRSNTPSPAPDRDVVRAIRGDSSFVLVHAGNLGFYGAWNALVTAARNRANEGVGLVFVGDGAQRSQVEAAAAGSDNIRFLDFCRRARFRPCSRLPTPTSLP